jgi:signal peptidase II
MQTPGRKGLAVTDRASHIRLWLTVLFGLVLDIASKYLGWHFLGGTPDEGGRIVAVIPGWLRLVASYNPGIVFGFNFGEDLGLGPVAGRLVTVLLTVATSGLIFYVFASSRARQRWLHLWCGLILAGAMGNLYDRLLFGQVRDLIQITAHATVAGYTLDWPYIFNVADVYLVVGVIAVAVVFIFGHGPQQTAPGAAPPRKDNRRDRA